MAKIALSKLCVLSSKVAWGALGNNEASAVAKEIINFVVVLFKSIKQQKWFCGRRKLALTLYSCFPWRGIITLAKDKH